MRDKTRRDIEKYYREEKLAAQYFDERFVRPFGKFIHIQHVSFLNTLIRRFRVRTVVDLGTGPARIATYLTGFERGYAVDQSRPMLSLAQKELRAFRVDRFWTVLQQNAFRLRLPVQVDLLLCFKVIRHYPLSERKKLYARIHRVLKKSGLFVMDVPNTALYRTQRSPVYDVSWTKDEIVKELRQAGFRVLLMKPLVHHFFLQSKISALCRFGLYSLPYFFIWLLDRLSFSQPYEWIVCAQKV